MFNAMSDHAKLAPSSASRWVECPGSVAIEAAAPDDSKFEAQRGDGHAAHWVAAECLLHGREASEYIGEETPGGLRVTEETAQAVAVYLQDVEEIAAQTDGTLQIEKKVSAVSISPDCWGTVDAFLIDYKRGIIYVWDYKHGFRVVDAFENSQVLCYAAGVLAEVEWDRFPGPDISLSLRVIQPRAFKSAGPIDVWTVKVSDLRAYITRLKSAAAEAMQPGALCKTGRHCRDCNGRAYAENGTVKVCEALQRGAAAAMQYTAQAQPAEMTPEAVGIELQFLNRAAELIKYRIDAIETAAGQIVKAGGRIPGFRVYESVGAAKWTRDPAEIFALGDFIGQELRKPQEPLTPAQAIKAGADKKLIAQYSKREKAGLKIEPDDGSFARKVFSQ